MEPRSEFRIDPSVSPAGPLLPMQLFVELSGTVRLADTVAESIDREFGMLLFHLPPNPWTPVTQSSYRELQSTATFPGIVNLAPLGLPSAIRVVWRLQWLERQGQLRFGVLRCGEVVDMKSRAEASGILMRMQAARQSGELPALCKATAELPCGTQETLDVRVERIADTLDLVQQRPGIDDDAGEILEWRRDCQRAVRTTSSAAAPVQVCPRTNAAQGERILVPWRPLETLQSASKPCRSRVGHVAEGGLQREVQPDTRQTADTGQLNWRLFNRRRDAAPLAPLKKEPDEIKESKRDFLPRRRGRIDGMCRTGEHASHQYESTSSAESIVRMHGLSHSMSLPSSSAGESPSARNVRRASH